MSIHETKKPLPITSILSLLFSLIAILCSILRIRLPFGNTFLLIFFSYLLAVFSVLKRNKGKKFALLRTFFTSFFLPILFVLSFLFSDGNIHNENSFLEDDGFNIQDWAIVVSIFSLIGVIIIKAMSAMTLQ